MLSAHLLLIFLMLLLLGMSQGYMRDGPSSQRVTYVNTMMASVDGNHPEAVRLPHTFTGLSPRTPVTLTATISPDVDDGVFIQTVAAPAKVYLNDQLTFEFGKEKNYPSFMVDPATEIHIVETHGDGSPMDLRIEFLSPKSSTSMTVEPLMISTSKIGILERSINYGTPWIFSMMQIICGIALVMISMCVLIIDKKGVLFLWLGLFNVMSGFWIFGSNNFTVTVFRSTTFLYLLSAIGLFTMMIPLLRFTKIVIEFNNYKPIWYMEFCYLVAAISALILQLLGVVPCSQSLPYFQITLPITLSVLSYLTAREWICYQNTAAKWFFPPVLVLTLSAYLDLVQYKSVIWKMFFPNFQLGSLIFLLIMGVEGGLFVKDSVDLRNRQRELEFENDLMEIRLQDQQRRTLQLAQHEQNLRQQRHDLRHQLVVIQELADTDSEKLQGYLKALLDNIPKASQVYCENTAVNAVVAHYAAMCQTHGIELTVHLDVPQNTHHVSDGSLCAVFGNLLENAVEACERISQGQKFIKIHSRLQYNMLAITMDNSFNGKLHQENGHFLSSKRDDFGVGLTSIRSIAEKTGGRATFQGDGYVFMSSVLLNL